MASVLGAFANDSGQIQAQILRNQKKTEVHRSDSDIDTRLKSVYASAAICKSKKTHISKKKTDKQTPTQKFFRGRVTSNFCQDRFSSIPLFSYLRAWIMSTLTLEDVLGECGVDPSLASQLASEGWTIQTFSCIVSDVHEMDSHWQELVPDVELTLLQKAQFRAAFRKCLALQCPDPPEAVAPGPSQESQASASWSESFAPKLDSVVIDGLKSKFLANYPSELLNQDTMPSTGCLAWYITRSKRSVGLGFHGSIGSQLPNPKRFHLNANPNCQSLKLQAYTTC